MQIKYFLTRVLVLSVCLICYPMSALEAEVQASASSSQQALRESAERGNAKAQYDLGSSYEFGFGEAKDYREALRWYRKAAEQGFRDARFALARMYFDGAGVQQDFAEAARWYGCPKPAADILSGCKAITYEALQREATELLEQMKCEVLVSNYGSAIDLNSDGSPEYQICCHDAPHGPCSAVVIGKIGPKWKDLSAGASFAYTKACAEFIVLASQNEGFHDICQPTLCSPINTETCLPTIWQFNKGRYRITRAKSTSPSR